MSGGARIVATVGADDEQATLQLLLDLAFAQSRSEVRDAFIDAAEGLRESKKQLRRRGHWLCRLLAESAAALDPGQVVDALVDGVTAHLVAAGIEPMAANAVGVALKKATSAALPSVDPAAQIRLGLNMLALMVCPDAEKCPVGDQAGLSMIKGVLAQEGSS